jgi:hypothetical protein
MASRLVMRKVRRQKFEAGDYVTMASMICLIVQAVLVHFALAWGTSISHFQDYVEDNWDKSLRELGGKLAIISRVFLIT